MASPKCVPKPSHLLYHAARFTDLSTSPIFVTEPVFHNPIPWLKAVAFKNILDMSVTLAVFQLPMGWLKASAK